MNREIHIRHCLELAERGRGHVGNGALVGSVLVRDGAMIAVGAHDRFGLPHAEAMLIKNLDQEIRQEDTLFVNLEPCCHTGKTPPCTDAIIAAGIRHVCFGMYDPDPRVAGKGVATLRSAGIRTEGPILQDVCRRFNKGYVSIREQGRPYVTLKSAKTREGAFANPDGSKRKITSVEQDAWSHEWLRSRHDAILVGVGTVCTDNPRLTVRLNKKSDQLKTQPYKVILDSGLRTPTTANVCAEHPDRTIIIATEGMEHSPRALALLATGVRIFFVPMSNESFVWEDLWRCLSQPAEGFFGITSMLLEGGPATWELFRRDGMVDEEVTLMGE